MKAVIMAGGEGSRLRPLTCCLPKPMVPIMNEPVMAHIIQLLKDHGIKETAVTLMYLPKIIKEYFQNGEKMGVCLKYFEENSPLGTAGSVKNAESFLNETFIVISGDALTDFDLTSLYQYHREKKASVTILLKSVPNPLAYGVVIAEKNGRIKHFLEKPSWGEVFSDTVNTGIYIIEPEILKLIPPNTKYDFSKDLFPFLLEKGYPVYGCTMEGYWCDIGNLTQYRKAHEDILKKLVNIDLQKFGYQQENGIWLGENIQIDPSAIIEAPAFIGPETHVEKNVQISPFSVLGQNCYLAEKSTIKNSILWDNVLVGKHATLRGATIANHTRLGNYTASYEGTVIGCHSELNEYAIVSNDVKIWPHKQISKKSTINTNLIWGETERKNIFVDSSVSGTINIDITPEFATNLASAYASILSNETPIVISSHNFGSCQMIRYGIMSGLISCGCKVINLEQGLLPLTRHFIHNSSYQGGIHIASKNHGEHITLTFMDQKGANINKALERKIENTFLQRNFIPIENENISVPIKLQGNLTGQYFRDIQKDIEKSRLQTRKFQLLISYDVFVWGNHLLDYFSTLNCQINLISSNNFSKRDLIHIRQDIKDELQKHPYDLGFIFHSDGETLEIYDAKGNVLPSELYFALMTHVMMSSKPHTAIAAPIYETNQLESIADKFAGIILRTKTATPQLMNWMLNPQILESQKGYKQFYFYYDSLCACSYLLDYLAKENLSFQNLVAALPPIIMSSRKIACPWHLKGKVMRYLIEENLYPHTLVDGVKLQLEDGWILILPDSEEPLLHLYCEGNTSVVIEKILNTFEKKIKSFFQQEELAKKISS